MEMSLKYFLFFLIVNLKFCTSIAEVLTTSATVAGIVAGGIGFALKCKFYECCDDNWIHFNERKFEDLIKSKVFGQHLAEDSVLKILRGFHRNKNPGKALVLSFHGLTGSGKNYISNMIANCTYKEGTASSFVHTYVGLKDFPHEHKAAEYMDRLQDDIVSFTRQCGRSLFIFDEIDKMPPGVIDSLKPYVDHYEQIDGIDFRKNIFIFLSNAGSQDITNLALKFWSEGRHREEITMRDLDPLINRGAFNERGGLQYSELLRSALVDAFIPFLPLEKKHVKKCVEAELKRKGAHLDSNMVKKIAEELLYFPDSEELYSISGCKRIEQKVELFLN